jgi:DNA-binding beta-propeller fold protein YncE
MKPSTYAAAVAGLFLLGGCASSTRGIPATPLAARSLAPSSVETQSSSSLTQLVNLDYSNGTISVFSISEDRARLTKSFAPGRGAAQGLAMDAQGRIYTTITATSSNPCAACVEVFTTDGKLVASLPAPILSGAPGAPSLTDVAVDAHRNVYVSDYGQQAIYFFPHASKTRKPTIVVQNSQNAASVLATPNGGTVVVSGGCGFASVRPYTRVSGGKYTAGSCFGIGTIALIGGAIDDQIDVMTPVDGVPALVSVSSPSGGSSFHTPGRLASISGVAFNSDASIAYVANARKERVYAFARPANGWLSATQPKLLATYRGFKNLDIIAVAP